MSLTYPMCINKRHFEQPLDMLVKNVINISVVRQNIGIYPDTKMKISKSHANAIVHLSCLHGQPSGKC